LQPPTDAAGVPETPPSLPHEDDPMAPHADQETKATKTPEAKEEKSKKSDKKAAKKERSPKSAKSAKSALKGTVTEDTDYDGDGDRPLPYVKVLLKDEQGNTLVSTFTDRNGIYDFSELEGGEYAVVETANTTCAVDTTDLQDLDTLLPGSDIEPASEIARDEEGNLTGNVTDAPVQYPSTVTLICTSKATSPMAATLAAGLAFMMAWAWL